MPESRSATVRGAASSGAVAGAACVSAVAAPGSVSCERRNGFGGVALGDPPGESGAGVVASAGDGVAAESARSVAQRLDNAHGSS